MSLFQGASYLVTTLSKTVLLSHTLQPSPANTISKRYGGNAETVHIAEHERTTAKKLILKKKLENEKTLRATETTH